MKVLIDGLDVFYGDGVKLIKTVMKREYLEEYPELIKWKLQMLYFYEDKWIELCRIDNYLHEGEKGSHIHLGERVIHVEMTIREAEKSIERIAARVLKEKYKKIWSDNDENPNC
jgi:hypothetical protein